MIPPTLIASTTLTSPPLFVTYVSVVSARQVQLHPIAAVPNPRNPCNTQNTKCELRAEELLYGTVAVLDSSQSKLLLVESEPLLADLTSFRLELLGYRIQVLAAGSEVVTALSRDVPDLLIVGTTLLDGDSVELVARLRNQYPAEQLPVLVCSLDPSLETVERAFAAGAQDHQDLTPEMAAMFTQAQSRRSRPTSQEHELHIGLREGENHLVVKVIGKGAATSSSRR